MRYWRDKKQNTKIKYKILLYLLLIMPFFSGKIVAAQTNGEIKGGIKEFPIIRGRNLELLIYANGFIEPEFEIKIIKKNDVRVLITDGYEIFSMEDGAYSIKLDYKYALSDKKIEIMVRDKADKENVFKKIYNLNVRDYSERYSEKNYEVTNERESYRDYIYDNKSKLESDESLDKSIIEYLDDDSIYSGEEISLTSHEGELYKLHVYDVDKDEWIIDDEPYRKNVSWKAKSEGRYILDLWIKDPESSERYDKWVLEPIYIKKKDDLDIEYFFTGSQPLREDDIFRFYLKTDTSEMVQYRAWIIGDEKNYINITNGYTEFVQGNQFHEFTYDGKLKPGRYKFWVWGRVLGEKNNWSMALGKQFEVIESNGGINEVFGGSIIRYPEDDIYVGDKVGIFGINVLEDAINDYLYKVSVYNNDGTIAIFQTKDYKDYIEWVPKYPGEYVLVIDGISKHDSENLKKKKSQGRRMYPIVVKERKNTSDTKKFMIVRDFKEFRYAIETDKVILIENRKIRDTYEKALSIIDEIIEDDMDVLDKLLALNDYIVKNVSYDESFYENPNDDSTSVYGTLIRNSAICQGYADTMKLFLDLLEIPNRMVEGEINTGGKIYPHIWNVVKIDGIEYHIDTTYNDPLPDKMGQTNYLAFLTSDDRLKKDHTWDIEKYGKVNNKKFDYFSRMKNPKRIGDWIYYINVEDRMKLYKIKKDGTENTQLTDEFVREFIVDEGYIYFTVKNGGYIYKIDVYGLSMVKLNNEPSVNIEKKGEWIVYENVYNSKYYMISSDGKRRLPFNR